VEKQNHLIRLRIYHPHRLKIPKAVSTQDIQEETALKAKATLLAQEYQDEFLKQELIN
jgi:hypothetical protein